MNRKDLKAAIEKQTNDAANIFLTPTKDNAVHTQGEWKIDVTQLVIENSDNKYICRCGWQSSTGGSRQEAEANAKLICTAVNNHYKMIEALEEIQELVNDTQPNHIKEKVFNICKQLLSSIK